MPDVPHLDDGAINPAWPQWRRAHNDQHGDLWSCECQGHLCEIVVAANGGWCRMTIFERRPPHLLFCVAHEQHANLRPEDIPVMVEHLRQQVPSRLAAMVL